MFIDRAKKGGVALRQERHVRGLHVAPLERKRNFERGL